MSETWTDQAPCRRCEEGRTRVARGLCGVCMENDLIGTEAERDSLQEQLAESVVQCNRFAAECDRLRAQVEQWKMESDALEEKLHRCDATIAELSSKVENLGNHIANRDALIEAKSATIAEQARRIEAQDRLIARYGAHLIGCDFRRASAAMSGMDCTCGFIDARDGVLNEQTAPQAADSFHDIDRLPGLGPTDEQLEKWERENRRRKR